MTGVWFVLQFALAFGAVGLGVFAGVFLALVAVELESRKAPDATWPAVARETPQYLYRTVDWLTAFKLMAATVGAAAMAGATGAVFAVGIVEVIA